MIKFFHRAACLASWLSITAGTQSISSSEPHMILVKKVVPPESNPYSPKTAPEKKREQFAAGVIRLFWSRPLDEQHLNNLRKKAIEDRKRKLGRAQPVFENKSIECLENPSCWQKDALFLESVAGIATMQYAFKNPKILWSHTVPWTYQVFLRQEKGPSDSYEALRRQQDDYKHTNMPEAFVLFTPKFLPDEFLIDSVVQFQGKEGWFHIRLVVTEKDTGEILLRSFILDPIQDIVRPSLYHAK